MFMKAIWGHGATLHNLGIWTMELHVAVFKINSAHGTITWSCFAAADTNEAFPSGDIINLCQYHLNALVWN